MKDLDIDKMKGSLSDGGQVGFQSTESKTQHSSSKIHILYLVKVINTNQLMPIKLNV